MGPGHGAELFGMTPATAFGARPEACHWLHPPLAGSS